MRPHIALFGRTGSGKSEIAEHLVSSHGYQRCHPGRLCRQITETLFQTQAKSVLNRVNDYMREIDPNVWLVAALRDCDAQRPIVIDGMRFRSNYNFLKGRGFIFWKVEASRDARVHRLKVRNQEFDWAADDEHAGEKELEDFAFDAVINNCGNSLSALYSEIDAVLQAHG